MEEMLSRQLALMEEVVSNYLSQRTKLNDLVGRLESLRGIIDEKSNDEELFELILGLEGINSEIIDKNRRCTSGEEARIGEILRNLEDWIKRKRDASKMA